MRDGLPTPGIFDGMAAYGGPRGEHRPDPQPREPLARRARSAVPVPAGKRYDPDPTSAAATRSSSSAATAGCARSSPCWAARTPTAPAAARRGARGSRARRSSTTARRDERTPGTGVPHGYVLRGPGGTRSGPVAAAAGPRRGPLRARGGRLAARRPLPDRGPRRRRLLPLRARRAARGRPATSRPSAARCRRSSSPGRPQLRHEHGRARARPATVEWVDDRRARPGSRTRSGRRPAPGRGDLHRTEGIWAAGGRVFFDCTTGGEARARARSGSTGRAAGTAASCG